MSDHLLALDQGTTSSRAIVFDRRGQPVASAQRELPQVFPRDGWVEHDPAQIWAGQLACAREALERAGLPATRLAAIGIANQRETTILWDRKTGLALHNAIVWQDRRTAARCAELRAQGLQADIRRRTGLLLDPYFSATKIAWLLDSIPGARARAQAGELAVGTVDSWLAWNLTGGARHVTDPSNAARTLLLDLRRHEWDDELLARFDIPRALLPAIVPSGAVLGESLPGLLGTPVPIAALAGDQQAAAFGQACLRPGMAKNTYGTGCFLLLHAGATPPAIIGRGLLATAGCTRPGAGHVVFLEGAVFSGGSVVQWLRDGLRILDGAAAVEALAREVPDSGGVSLVPAFTGLGAPEWDPLARGTIVGITRATTRAHVARAALEAIALQSAQLLRAMQDSGAALTELRVDGGASRNDLLLQLQADLLGVPVLRPRVTETTALGAAFLAGLATGLWSGEDEISALWQLEKRFEPQATPAWREDLLGRWRRAVERSRDWAQDEGAPATDLAQRSRAALWSTDAPAVHDKEGGPRPPKPRETFPLPIVRGEGGWLVDTSGRRLLDGTSSGGVNLFGHANPRIQAALARQARTLEQASLAGCTHAPAVELCERLSALTEGTLGQGFFASEGASVVAMALRKSRGYWRACGQPEKRGVVRLRGSENGGPADAADAAVSTGWLASPDARGALAGEGAAQVAVRAAADLGALLERSSGTIAAVLIEPLVQCAAGVAVHHARYLHEVRSLCDRHGVHFVADETSTGFGRTGTFYACEQAGVWPDFLCLSKGMTGGWLPLAVGLARGEIARACAGGQHPELGAPAHSYAGNPLACAAALATLDIFRDEDALEANRERAQRLAHDLAPLASDPRVGHFRRCGTIFAFDVRADLAPDAAGFAQRYFEAALGHGALLRPIGRTVYLMPPYILSPAESAWLAEAALDTLGEVVGR